MRITYNELVPLTLESSPLATNMWCQTFFIDFMVYVISQTFHGFSERPKIVSSLLALLRSLHSNSCEVNPLASEFLVTCLFLPVQGHS